MAGDPRLAIVDVSRGVFDGHRISDITFNHLTWPSGGRSMSRLNGRWRSFSCSAM
jgi:hypothetical protein